MIDDTGDKKSGDVDRRAHEAFVDGVVARGEAASPDETGVLPPGATHEILGRDDQGRPILKRRRFSVS